MEQYATVLRELISLGEGDSAPRKTRAGDVHGSTNFRTISVTELPLLNGKRIHWRSVVGELLWFLQGHTNVRWLQERGIRIWDEWADESGELGPIYGKQLRSHGVAGVDQVVQLVRGIISDPTSRRHVLTTWSPSDLPKSALPPCHGLVTQAYVDPVKGTLELNTYQRSADWFLGVPFNLPSYWLLGEIIARLTGLRMAKLNYVFGDCHLYVGHVQPAKTYLDQLEDHSRDTLVGVPTIDFSKLDRPLLELAHGTTSRRISAFLNSLNIEDFVLTGYVPRPAIKAKVNV